MAIDKNDPKFQEFRETVKEIFKEVREEEKAAQLADEEKKKKEKPASFMDIFK